jgi:AraC-like DNA-binding protein
MERMSCNGRALQAFARVLSQHPNVSEQTRARLREQCPVARVGVSETYEAIAGWVRETGDEDLGLKAGALVKFGEGGAFDFAMRSASSLRSGLEIATRHARLLNDALEPKLELPESRALVRLDSALPWPRAAADFMLSVWYLIHIRVQLPASTQVEVWLAHSEPASTAQYERVFHGAELRFDARCYGIAFDQALADQPLISSDPALHAAHCDHLEFVQSQLSAPLGFAVQARELMAYEMRSRTPTSTSIARSLRVSRRTLVRRLREEGTCFKAQLDALRHELALDLIARPERTLLEITKLLRFSHVQAFHRAFRRWTSQTPAQFRERALYEVSPLSPSAL